MMIDREEKLGQLKRQRSSAKRKFTRKHNIFRESVGNDDPLSVLQSNFDDVNNAFLEVEKVHEEYIDLLTEVEQEESVMESEDTYIIELERKKIEAHVLLAKKRDSDSKLPECKTKVKVKALEPPKFDGNAREYPSFRADFERLMQNSFGKDPYALKQCLSGEALKTVKGVENYYELMMKRLDEKFGNHRKIVDLVLSDFKSLRKIQDGDSKEFVKMVDKVETCWLDLKKMNLTAEMNISNMVSHIEKVLPSTQKREWVIIAEGIAESDKIFSELLKFLLREKRVLEYMDSGIRRTGTSETNASAHSVLGDQNIADESRQEASEIVEALRKIQLGQENQSKKLEQCMTNLASLATHSASSNNSYHRNSYPSNSAASTSEWGHKCWYHATNGHNIWDCVTFQKLGSHEKISVMRQNSICFNCLQGGHMAMYCKVRRTCDVRDDNNTKCGRFHHPLLHRAHVEGILFHNSSHVKSKPQVRPKTLLMVSKVYSQGYPITTLWDPGSDITIITHDLASKLGLKGKDVELSMTKVGNITEKYTSKEYVIPVTDKEGKVWNIKAFGITEISSNVSQVDMSQVVELFDNVLYEDLVRPSGNIDFLVGSDYCELLPNVVQVSGKLQLMKNQFGFCVKGSHPCIESRRNNISYVSVRVNHLASNTHINDIIVRSKPSIKSELDNFFDVESLGVSCVPKCGGCKCGKCSLGNCNYTIQEEKELAIIEKGLRYDGSAQQWSVTYPWIKDPNDLPNNVSVAIARMKSTERRLGKLGQEYAQNYQNQIDDMQTRNVCRKISHFELRTYKGPVHYVQHHEVHKPDSTSTPIRIVFNSSASYMGHILNNYWCKGPNVMNNLLGILFRFRQKEVAVVGDISKMYHTIKLSYTDQHTHRFVWRDMNVEGNPDHYALTTVTFGDRPSGTIAMLALKHTAEMYKNIYPQVVDMIVNNSYVDDILYSTRSKQEAYTLIRDSEEVLVKGGFKIKHWVMSGMHNEIQDLNLLNTNSEKVLGLHWDTKGDYFTYKVKVNFSPKFKGVCTKPDLTREEINSEMPQCLTRRMVLRQVASIYDPLGLITPVTLQAKFLMRELVTRSASQSIMWDDPLPVVVRNQWSSFFKKLYDLEDLSFTRCLTPALAEGNPTLVIYADGSSQAYGTCAYVRWKLQSGRYEARLIAAKNKIAPSKQLTIPRLELCAAVLSCRLREMIQREFDWTFDSVIHIVDSAIVRAQIQKESYGFSTFVATRIAEIQTKSDPCEWWWVSSKDNPADITTRYHAPLELHHNSVWQRGPDYMNHEMNTWPISKHCNSELPDKVAIALTCSVDVSNFGIDLTVIKVECYSSYVKLLRVTSRLLAAFRDKSLKGISDSPTSSQLQRAESLWIHYVQKDLPSDWRTRYQSLGPNMQNGIIVVGQRISKWLKDNWNCEYFVLLPSKHPFTRLYIEHLHDIDHAGVEVTLAKLQKKFWVPGARKIIKSVKSKCVKCRIIIKKIEGQSMGQVMLGRLKPSPLFYHTAIDLFGPFDIRDTVKRRTKGKSYGVIFNCLVSRAVYIDLADGYSTAAFLATFRRFTSLRGFPSTIHSDGGTQLVAASKELRDMMSKWNMSEVFNFGADQGMSWSFNRSADAPWENGCSEALVKLIKRGLSLAIGDNILTFGELQTVLFEVANVLNERPIGINPQRSGGYIGVLGLFRPFSLLYQASA